MKKPPSTISHLVNHSALSDSGLDRLVAKSRGRPDLALESAAVDFVVFVLVIRDYEEVDGLEFVLARHARLVERAAVQLHDRL